MFLQLFWTIIQADLAGRLELVPLFLTCNAAPELYGFSASDEYHTNLAYLRIRWLFSHLPEEKS